SGMTIYDLRHKHPLDKFSNSFSPDCTVCRRPIGETLINGCDICWFVIHESCANQMPNMIRHSLHVGHTLSPFFTEEYRHFQCFSCEEKLDGVIVFRCYECEFFMCVQCALKPDISACEGQNVDLIPPICHEEPMTLEEKKHEDGIKCYSCQLPCSGPTYTCKTCKYFFHKSCMELPPEIQQPLHPHHPLKRHILRPFQTLSCESCHENFPFIVFQCNKCNFNLCPQCISLKPTIKHQQHNHPLCLVDNKDKYLHHCDGFGTYCRQVVVPNEDKRYVLRCVECDFNLHLLCGRLPCIIKHECHVHPLNFVDSVVEDDSNEFYCDACEKGRDPRVCLYYCADCNYKVHLRCVLSK
ncbi:hypothetical protein UlMin_010844, partial [Ulmus minor]